MRQITKDFLTIALLSDPANNDMVKRLELRLRSGAVVALRALKRVKGGLDASDADHEDRIQMIDEDDIAAVMLTLSEAAPVHGISSFDQVRAYALDKLKMKVAL